MKYFFSFLPIALLLLFSCNTVVNYTDRSLKDIDFDIAFTKDDLSPSDYNKFRREHYFHMSFNSSHTDNRIRYIHLSYGLGKDFRYWIGLNLFAETHCPYFVEGESLLTARLDSGEDIDFPYQKSEKVGTV
ncbi:hypothetical protein AB751O23_DF_00010, partial [Chlamydiales bacterium SCGC AB-751-O23]